MHAVTRAVYKPRVPTVQPFVHARTILKDRGVSMQTHRRPDLTHGSLGDGMGARGAITQHVAHVVGLGSQLGAPLADGREHPVDVLVEDLLTVDAADARGGASPRD